MSIPTWSYGVMLSVTACALSNVGVNLQKSAHLKCKEGENFVTKPRWIFGIVLMLCGSICDTLSFGFAPQSLLAPLGTLTLMFNMLIASIFLEEKLSLRDVICTFVVVGGTVLCICFGAKHEAPAFTIHELLKLFIKTPFIIFGSIYLGVMVVLTFMIGRAVLDESSETGTKIQAFCYSCIAGMCGGLSVLFAKSSDEIIKATMKGDDQFVHFFTYFEISFLLICIFSQIRMLNRALSSADALFVVPIYQTFWVISNILMGMLYFQEYRDLDWIQFLVFSIGIVIVLVGVYLLSQRNVSTSKDSKDDDFLTPSMMVSPQGISPSPAPYISINDREDLYV